MSLISGGMPRALPKPTFDLDEDEDLEEEEEEEEEDDDDDQVVAPHLSRGRQKAAPKPLPAPRPRRNARLSPLETVELDARICRARDELVTHLGQEPTYSAIADAARVPGSTPSAKATRVRLALTRRKAPELGGRRVVAPRAGLDDLEVEIGAPTDTTAPAKPSPRQSDDHAAFLDAVIVVAREARGNPELTVALRTILACVRFS